MSIIGTVLELAEATPLSKAFWSPSGMVLLNVFIALLFGISMIPRF